MKSLRIKEFLKSRSGARTAVALLLVCGLLLVLALSPLLGGINEEGETEERRLAELCSALEGVGRCRAVITFAEQTVSFGKSERRVDGVAIACQGGNDSAVRLRIIRLVRSLYDIGANRVTVESLD